MTELCSKKRRGFNLIEAAIVLGVVGLVVAGIWVAAAALSEKLEVKNVKDFVLYSQGLALKYSQNYPITTYLSLRKVMPENMVLPGGFMLYYYSPTNGYPMSANDKVVVYPWYYNVYSQSGHNVDGTTSSSIRFLEDARAVPWVYTPRPGVCAGLLSWMIGLGTSKHVLVGYSDIDDSPTNETYWDSQSGSAPPTISTCKTLIFMEIFIY